ncbi:hypothetical protein [uncultured Kordia sp.]|uniref:hypothetical protein n=1 Tax=uncultured Kordia sp. TaxID=507699 RepID=UPI002615A000|nr:hypothetical protein [uncultured Kordia sp.]
MKKKNLKSLVLNKKSVSNLSHTKGGFERVTLSQNFIDVCCPVFGTGECLGSENTNCGGGDPTGNCLTHEETCVCFLPTWEQDCE